MQVFNSTKKYKKICLKFENYEEIGYYLGASDIFGQTFPETLCNPIVDSDSPKNDHQIYADLRSEDEGGPGSTTAGGQSFSEPNLP